MADKSFLILEVLVIFVGMIALVALAMSVVCFETKLPTSGGGISGDLNMSNHPIVAAEYLAITGLPGADQGSRYIGATLQGAPSAGDFLVGDFVIDLSGNVRVYTGPNTWVAVGSLHAVPTLTYASLTGQSPTFSASRFLGSINGVTPPASYLAGDMGIDLTGDVWIYGGSQWSSLKKTLATTTLPQLYVTSVNSQTVQTQLISIPGTVPSRFLGSVTGSPTTTGTAGDWVVDLTGNLWVYTTGSLWKSMKSSSVFLTLTGGTMSGDLTCSGNVNLGSAQQSFQALYATSVVTTTLNGTLLTASQTNITSVGSLTQLAVQGGLDLTGGGITASQFLSATFFNCYTPTTQAYGRYVGATTGGPPSGVFNVGDFVIDQTGNIWIFTLSNAWQALGAQGAYLPLTGGTLTGDLIPSGTSISIGSATTPFANLYASNLYGAVQQPVQTGITTLPAVTSLNGISVGNGTLGGFFLQGSIYVNGTVNVASNAQPLQTLYVTNVYASFLSGAVQNPIQTNITSVGTLTSLNVTGNVNLSGHNMNNISQLQATLLVANGSFLSATQSRLIGSTTSGPPSSAGQTGDFVIDQTGNVWIYSGSWKGLNAQGTYLPLAGGSISGNISCTSSSVNLGGAGDAFGTVFAGAISGTLASGPQTGITVVGTLSSGTWNASTLSVAYGGTGQTSLTLNQLLLGNNTLGITSLSGGVDGTLLVGGTPPAFSANPVVTSITIANPPVNPTDAVNKAYVDSIGAGLLFRTTCYCATTTALTATYANGSSGVGATLTNSGSLMTLAVDGVNPGVNARVLVLYQTDGTQNGIYTVTTAGDGSTAWVLTRATDYNQTTEIHVGDLIPVSNGTTNGATTWLQSAVITTIGTDAFSFSEYSYSASTFLQVNNRLSELTLQASTVRTNLGLSPLASQSVSVNQVLIGYSDGTVQGPLLTTGQILIGKSSGSPQNGMISNGTNLTWTSNGTSLVCDLTGVVGVSNGGTGISSINPYGLLFGGWYSLADMGSQGQVLTSQGPGAYPKWMTPNQGTVTAITAGSNLTGGTITASGTLSVAGTLSSVTWGGAAIDMKYGGTGTALAMSAGGIVYSTATTLAVLPTGGLTNAFLVSGPSWISPVASSILLTDSTGAPGWVSSQTVYTLPGFTMAGDLSASFIGQTTHPFGNAYFHNLTFQEVSSGRLLFSDSNRNVSSAIIGNGLSYDSTTSTVSVLYDNVNIVLSSSQLTTVQNITTTSSPTFQSLSLVNGSDSVLVGVVGTLSASYNFNLPTSLGGAGTILTSSGGGTSAMTWSLLSSISVSSLTGTSHQITASASTGGVTLSLPQSLGVTSSPTFTSLALTGALLVHEASPSTQNMICTADPTAGSVGGTITFLSLYDYADTFSVGVINGFKTNTTSTDFGGSLSLGIRSNSGPYWVITCLSIDSGGNVTLASPLTVSNGGTGISSPTNYYGLVIGGASSTANLQVLTTGTTDQVLTSQGAASNPTWGSAQTPGTLTGITAGTNISVTTSSGAITIDLVSPLAQSVIWNANPITVDHGGTGFTASTTITVNGLIIGGTTSTAALQCMSTLGTTGQVLTSQGSSSQPTWTTPSTGTVQSVTVGKNIKAASGNTTITVSDTIDLLSPLAAVTWNAASVSPTYGGTGWNNTTAAGANPYGLLMGNSTSDGIQTLSSGSSGQVLISQGGTGPPVWTNPNLGTITSITAGSTYLTGGTITSSGTIDIKSPIPSTVTWHGSLIGVGFGGTGSNLTPSAGAILYSTSTAFQLLAGSSVNHLLLSGSNTTPTWLAPSVSSFLVTDSKSNVSWSSYLPSLTMTGDLTVSTDNSYDLGTSTLAFASGYFTNITFKSLSGMVCTDSSGSVTQASIGNGLSFSGSTLNLSIDSTNLIFSSGKLTTIQNITTSATPTFAGLTLTSVLSVGNGGTGISSVSSNALLVGQGTSALSVLPVSSTSGVTLNGQATWGTNPFTLGGNLTTTGGFNLTLTSSGVTSITLPTSGTLDTIPTPVLTNSGIYNFMYVDTSNTGVLVALPSSSSFPTITITDHTGNSNNMPVYATGPLNGVTYSPTPSSVSGLSGSHFVCSQDNENIYLFSVSSSSIVYSVLSTVTNSITYTTTSTASGFSSPIPSSTTCIYNSNSGNSLFTPNGGFVLASVQDTQSSSCGMYYLTNPGQRSNEFSTSLVYAASSYASARVTAGQIPFSQTSEAYWTCDGTINAVTLPTSAINVSSHVALSITGTGLYGTMIHCPDNNFNLIVIVQTGSNTIGWYVVNPPSYGVGGTNTNSSAPTGYVVPSTSGRYFAVPSLGSVEVWNTNITSLTNVAHIPIPSTALAFGSDTLLLFQGQSDMKFYVTNILLDQTLNPPSSIGSLTSLVTSLFIFGDGVFAGFVAGSTYGLILGPFGANPQLFTFTASHTMTCGVITFNNRYAYFFGDTGESYQIALPPCILSSPFSTMTLTLNSSWCGALALNTKTLLLVNQICSNTTIDSGSSVACMYFPVTLPATPNLWQLSCSIQMNFYGGDISFWMTSSQANQLTSFQNYAWAKNGDGWINGGGLIGLFPGQSSFTLFLMKSTSSAVLIYSGNVMCWATPTMPNAILSP